jgi:hypothetical protein
VKLGELIELLEALTDELAGDPAMSDYGKPGVRYFRRQIGPPSSRLGDAM